MKIEKKILALGPAGSYGHEAALKAQQLIDPHAEWSIVFCRSNMEVLDTAIKYGECAVVPVQNSNAGPVKTIADGLFRTCDRDSHVRVIGEIELSIEHCLLSRDIISLGKFEPTEILSHSQPIKQCSKFLAEKGWSSVCKETDSTSRAAQMIAQDSSDAMRGCIASAFAAKTYNLNVVKKCIQNDARNATSFAILAPLKERALMKNSISGKVIALLGADGGYGKWLTTFFTTHGCTVLPIEEKTPLKQAESIVEKADVVLFSVPTLDAPEIMQGFTFHSNSRQLWLDVTSLKVDVVHMMMKSEAEVVGLHPLCAPPRAESLQGQSLAVCIGRLSAWGPWFSSLLSLLEAHIDIVEPDVHDHLVMERQGIPHALMFIEGVVMRGLNMDVAESFRVASPFYKLLLAAVCRMHSQNPRVYAGIQIGNPHMLPALHRIKTEVENLIEIIENRDEAAFIKVFNENRKHIGMETLMQGNEAFESIISLQADLEWKNVLTIQSQEDTPGLLSGIVCIIAKYGVSMVFMHSCSLKGGIHRFHIGLDRSIDSTEVFKIIQDINCSGKAKVI